MRWLLLLLPFLFLACGGTPAHPTQGTEPAHATQALHKRAQDAERKRDYHTARKLYQEAVDSSPDAVSAAFATREMASALLFWGELPGAQELLQQSLEHDPKQVPVWHNLGIVQAKLGREEAAEESLQQAVRLLPKEPRSRVALAALLVKRKKLPQAIEQYEALLTLDIPPKIENAIHKALKLLRRDLL